MPSSCRTALLLAAHLSKVKVGDTQTEGYFSIGASGGTVDEWQSWLKVKGPPGIHAEGGERGRCVNSLGGSKRRSWRSGETGDGSPAAGPGIGATE